MGGADTRQVRLVRLFDSDFHTVGELAYYLSCHPKRLRHKRLSALRDTLLREAAKSQRLA